MIKVIIVEDDMLVANLNKSYVEHVPEYKVLRIFKDGEEALEYLQNNEADLMLLDVYMPKLDGISLLKEMRKRGIMTDVILVTAAKETNSIDSVLKLGAVDYLIKPFDYDRINKSLKNYLLRYNLIHKNHEFKQEDIDFITNSSLMEDRDSLPKGLNDKTLKRIYEFMKENSEIVFTSELVAEKMKISRVTVRKYLDYLSDNGKILTNLEYKTVGRPLTLYEYIPN